MSASAKVAALLAECGAVLKRSRKHEVWALPNGRTYVQSSTPSDRRAADNQLTVLRRELGVTDPERGKPGERRERKAKCGRQGEKPWLAGARNTALADQLRASGTVEEALRSRIADLEAVIDQYDVRYCGALEREAARARKPGWWSRFGLQCRRIVNRWFTKRSIGRSNRPAPTN